jgi:hypothetical protein
MKQATCRDVRTVLQTSLRENTGRSSLRLFVATCPVFRLLVCPEMQTARLSSRPGRVLSTREPMMAAAAFYPLAGRPTSHAAAIYYRERTKTWHERAATVPDGAPHQAAYREIAEGYEKIAAQYEQRSGLNGPQKSASGRSLSKSSSSQPRLHVALASQAVRAWVLLIRHPRGEGSIRPRAPASRRAPHTPRPTPTAPAALADQSGREQCDECAPPALAGIRGLPPAWRTPPSGKPSSCGRVRRGR